MKKPLIITGSIFTAFLLLFVFNKLASKKISDDMFTEARNGEFEISVITAGELIAERSIDIKGPEMARGRDIRATQVKIQDLIPEGTMVQEGDYIATLDRTELSNNLKDANEYLAALKNNLHMRILDTTVQLFDYRNEIINQRYRVSETEMTLRNSKYEAPSIIRQAEINFDQAKRVLDQRLRGYMRRQAQLKNDIYNLNFWVKRLEKRVNDLEEVLADFTITAPASGMIMYKRDWRGNKRKTGSNIDARDRVVAILPDLSSMLSKIYISEVDISKIQKGQKVDVKVDAFPKKAFKGQVSYVANIGEKLPNTNDKVFEVQIRIDGNDPALRPSMTTGNKIIIKSFDNAVFIPAECVQAGIDSIPFVYLKNGIKQVVIPGESNEKNMIIERGLKAGAMVYLTNPEETDKFRLEGEDLIPVLKKKAHDRKHGVSSTEAALQGSY